MPGYTQPFVDPQRSLRAGEWAYVCLSEGLSATRGRLPSHRT